MLSPGGVEKSNVHTRFVDDLSKDQELFGVSGVVGVWHRDNSFRHPLSCASPGALPFLVLVPGLPARFESVLFPPRLPGAGYPTRHPPACAAEQPGGASNARKCFGMARPARFELSPHEHWHPVHTNQNAVAGLRFNAEDLSKGELPAYSVSVGTAAEERLVNPGLLVHRQLYSTIPEPLHLGGSSKHNSHADPAASCRVSSDDISYCVPESVQHH